MNKELEDKELAKKVKRHVDELDDVLDKITKRPKDFDDKKIKLYMEFECCDQLTVGELKKILLDYPDDAVVYMEASNASSHGNTMWSQKALDTYPCTRHMTNKKALMIVGDMR